MTIEPRIIEAIPTAEKPGILEIFLAKAIVFHVSLGYLQ